MERKIKPLENIEKKNIYYEIKEADGAGQFSGYASVFNIEDSYHDIILPSAFSRTLQRENAKDEIKMLWQHSHDKPIGHFNVIKEDSVGLYVEGQIMLDIQQGREAYELIKQKSVSGLSIGYIVRDADYDSKNNIRIIKDIELFEISIVTFPANKYSNILQCKSRVSEELLIDKLNKIEKIFL